MDLDFMYTSVGRAVRACQQFEFALTLLILVFEQSDATGLGDVRALTKADFKMPSKNVLTRLSKSIDVDESFADRVLSLIERRHTLIHRWLIEHNDWPEDLEHANELSAFAMDIVSEAESLAKVMIGHLAVWLERFPEMRENFPNVIARHKDSFQPIIEKA